MSDLLIRNGIVVDGTGAPAYPADVRVEAGMIAQVGLGLKSKNGEKVYDAAGCFVTPGFIESHTHYDATMWWQPDLDPLPGYGTTTIIGGNCGFAAAPIADEKTAQLEMVKIFSFFEDIPLGPFLKNVPWNWRRWSEYKESLTKSVRLPTNYSMYVGHISIRLAVMGIEAWDRTARPDEIQKMAALLDDALAAGALGMSDNLLDHDGQNRKIPTLVADDAEFAALFDVLDQYPGVQYQTIVDHVMRNTAPEQVDRMARLLKGRKFRIQFCAGIPSREYSRNVVELMRKKFVEMRANGIDAWPGYSHVALTGQVSIFQSLLFAQSNEYVWHEVVLAASDEEKIRILKDPGWRARARKSWDTKASPRSPFTNADRLLLTALGSDTGAGPFDMSLQDYAKQLGVHRSDAMAEWLLNNGVRSAIRMAPDALMDDVVIELMRDPHTVGNLSDAGAHSQMLCGGGENILVFTKYVRELKAISIEQAVHLLTGKLAAYFNLPGIGEIKTGKRADITVFKLDEVERREMERVYDADDGQGGITWRYSRQPAPVRLTLVNGEITFDGTKYTGAKPGVYLVPTPHAAEAIAVE
jgi:N-acyl-D-aspartate/D-glutamate deacylase